MTVDRRTSHSAFVILAVVFTTRCFTTTQNHTPSRSIEERREDERFERMEIRPSFAPGSQSIGTLNVPIDTSLGDWRSIGPRNYGGKVYDLAVGPTNANIVYAAYGAQGGLWKTSDGGRTWARANDATRDNSFASVAIAQANSNVIIAGLGAPDLPDADHGLLKSSDGGLTWTAIGPFDTASSGFYRVVIDPLNANIVYTATENRVYKTTNGGGSWTTLTSYTGASNNFDDLPDLVMNPGDHNTLMLGQKSIGILRTTNGGATWSNVDPAPAKQAATVMAYSPSNSNIVYAERESGLPGTAMQTYRSIDGGQTWTPMALINTIYHQGRYDESIVVDPANFNHVFVANSYLFETRDGFATFSRVSGEPHPDHLRLVYAPSNASILFSGNDGGVWRSTDSGVTWSRFDQGVETNISFGIDVDPVSGVIYMSPGDYGCTRYSGNADQWDAFYGPEWTDFFISPYNRNTIFSGLGTIQLTTDGGATWIDADPEPSGPRPYRYPFVYHPTVSKTIYTSTKKLYKSTDLGNTWTVISPAAFDTLGYYIDWFAVSSRNPSIIYVLSGIGLWQTTDGGATWNQRNTTSASGKVTLAIVSSSPDQVYIGGYGGIQLCTNNGATCSDRSANLGSVRVRDIVIDPTNESHIFLGTDEGVFVTQNAGTSWSRLGANFPPIRAWDLSLFSHHLYASSGQGVWEFSRTAGISPAIATYLGGGTTVVPLAAAPTLSWNSYNGSASISAIGNVPSFGVLTVHPATTTTYTLTVGSGTNVASKSIGVTVDQSLLTTMLPRDFAATNAWKYEEFLSTGATTPLVYRASATNGNGTATSVGPAYLVSSGFGYVQYDTTRNIILMHPQGATDRQICATFTASAAGTYRFTGAFARFNDYLGAGDGVIVSIIKNVNTTQPLFRTAISANNSFDPSDVFSPKQTFPQWFDVRATLAVGEVVRFLVSAGSAGSNAFDGTAFKVAVDSASACSYSISPTSSSIDAGGGSGTVSVAAGSGCGWTASSDASWITITSGSSGSGTGSVAYQVAANSTTAQRQGTLEIAGSVVTITQTPSLRRRSARH